MKILLEIANDIDLADVELMLQQIKRDYSPLIVKTQILDSDDVYVKMLFKHFRL